MFEKLKRFWKKLRRLRRFLTVVFFVLIIVVALFLGYCTTREIPLFVKQIIISKLHERGIEAEFGRAYLKLPGTVVARDVKLAGDAEDRHRVSFETGRLELGVFFWSLFGTSPELSVLSVGDGVIVLEAGGDKNGHDGDIRIENIGFDVESSTPGVLTLKNLQARFRRTSIVASGSITNGRRLSEWKPPASISIHDKEEKKDLGRIIEFINSVNLDGASSLKFEFYGNGRDGGSFNIHADAKLPGIRTAGIEASQVHFVADARTDSLEGGVIDIDYSVDFGALSHGWVSVTNGSSAGALSLSNGESVHLKRFTLSADAAEADDVQFENVGVKGAGEAPDLTGVLTNCIVEFDADTVTGGGFKFKDVESVVEVDSWDIREDALKGRVHSSVGEVHSEYGLAGNVRLNSDFSSNGAVAPELLKKLGPWRYLVSYRLGIGLSVEEIESPRFHAGGLEFDAGWNPPVLDIRNLALNLYGGRFEGAGDIDVATRRVTGKFYTDFDPHGLDPILPERAYRLLSQYGWKKPPKVWAEAGLTLPPWSEWGGNWSNAVKPTVEMSGRFEIEDGSFRGIPATGAESHFYFTNLTWYLPDLIVRRPEGEVRLEYTCYTPTKDFRWNVKSSVIPTAVRPALESQKHKEAVDDFDFREPPSISGVVWGRWHSRELLGFEGGINASNFVYRGEDVESLRAHAAFTNGWIKGTDIELERAEGRITGDGVGCDIPRRIVCFTNIVSTVDPMAVARAIGPKSAKAIEPYEFKEPPMVEVNGVLPVKERKETRMRFDVSGDEFSFWKFRIPEVSSVLYWHTNHLVFEGVEASFYDGRLNGAADFDLSPSEGAVFNFDASVTNVNTHSMVSDLFGSGQTLEGDLSGRLIVTSAHTKDNGSWNGYGKVSLEDGLIWDVPVFGIVSSVLNAFIPGLGNSRADQANAFFTIDNSVIHTDELEICAPGLRLLYRGDVDFDGNIDGVAEAVFLRDVWGVGLAMRIVLKPLTKLFEYKIEGTLSEPVYEPVYLLPKLIILPLRPFSTMKDYLIPSESEPAR